MSSRTPCEGFLRLGLCPQDSSHGVRNDKDRQLMEGLPLTS
jgi:hypothetical protein